jgi:hypothetical protein
VENLARKIKYAKNGQAYIILANGRAKFIKGRRKAARRKTKVRKTYTTTRKKSRSRGGNLAKKRTVRRRSNNFLGKLTPSLMGAGGVVLYESLLSPMIPLQGTSKDLLELVGGIYLSKKRGFLGATGKSLVAINSYQLIRNLVGTKLTGLVSGLNQGNGAATGNAF